MRRDKEAKTLQNGGKQESRSCTGSGILWVVGEVISGAVLYDLVFFFFFLFIMNRAALFCTCCNQATWSAGKPVKTELQ